VAPAQGVDRAPAARFCSEKRGDRLRRGGECGLVIDRTSVAKASDRGAIGAPRVVGARIPAVLGGCFGTSAKLATGTGRSTMVSRSNHRATSPALASTAGRDHRRRLKGPPDDLFKIVS
jgi:hypothetical protein